MSEALIVASYNVHGCVGGDGVHAPVRVARVISSLQAGIVGLQEIDSRPDDGDPVSDLDEVAGEAGFAYVAGAVRTRKSGSYGNALLTNYPVLQVRRIDLSVAKCEPRGALDVDLQVGEHKVRVVVTHFGLNPAERRAQARHLMATVSAQTEGMDLTILLGDLNEWFVMGRPLRWLHKNFGFAPSLATFPSKLPLFALDRIWVHPRQCLLGVKRIYKPQTRVASDHLPLVARVRLVSAS